MLSEPGPSQFDLHFVLFGFPVRIHPLFWLVALILGPYEAAPIYSVLWVPAVLVSILIHELGHALVMQRFGSRAHIVLHGLGGLAVPDGPYYRRPGTLGRILISVAGPGAGFLLAAVIVAVFYLARQPVEFHGPWRWLQVIPEVFLIDFPRLSEFLNNLLWVSVFWGLFNLLPIYPLDGGHAAEDALEALNPRDGVRQAMILSIVTAGALAAYELIQVLQRMQAGDQGASRGFFNVAFLGYLAYFSYQRLQAYGRGPWW